jgi:hypothetical protein
MSPKAPSGHQPRTRRFGYGCEAHVMIVAAEKNVGVLERINDVNAVWPIANANDSRADVYLKRDILPILSIGSSNWGMLPTVPVNFSICLAE